MVRTEVSMVGRVAVRVTEPVRRARRTSSGSESWVLSVRLQSVRGERQSQLRESEGLANAVTGIFVRSFASCRLFLAGFSRSSLLHAVFTPEMCHLCVFHPLLILSISLGRFLTRSSAGDCTGGEEV